MTLPAPTALLLHAFPLHAGMWREQRVALEAAGFTVLAPDLPGFGNAGGELVSLQDTAARLLGGELLAEQGLGELPPTFDLVGLSMGGYLALELLAQAPERISRLVLCNTNARPDPEDKQRDRAEQAERVLREGVGFMVEAAEAEYRAGTFRVVRDMVAQARPESVAAALRALAGRADHRGTLRGAGKPTLVIGGSEDGITPPELSQELAELSGGELRILAGAAHLSNLDAPGAFNGALLGFLQG